ncbi:MAG: hypothetical protein AAF787_15205, partial [Chloroflexota bacterium]
YLWGYRSNRVFTLRTPTCAGRVSGTASAANYIFGISVDERIIYISARGLLYGYCHSPVSLHNISISRPAGLLVAFNNILESFLLARVNVILCNLKQGNDCWDTGFNIAVLQ